MQNATLPNDMPTGQRQSGESQHFESVHLLRGFAALIVLLGHNFDYYSLPGLIFVSSLFRDINEIGVYIFFVISGFVLPLSLADKYKPGDYPRFISKRIVRIEPTYLVSVGLTLIVALLTTSRVLPKVESSPFAIDRLLAHLFYLVPLTDHQWYNPVYWTLAVEFQFYLIIALIFPLLRRGYKQSIITVCLLGSVFFVSECAPRLGLLAHAPLFAVGSCCFLALEAKTRRQRIISILLIVVLSGVCGISSMLSAIGAMITAWLIVFWKPRRRRIRYLGTISYSLYVVHLPVLSIVHPLIDYFGSGSPLLYVVTIANVSLSILAAHLLYVFVERPSQVLSKRIRYSEPTAG